MSLEEQVDELAGWLKEQLSNAIRQDTPQELGIVFETTRKKLNRIQHNALDAQRFRASSLEILDAK